MDFKKLLKISSYALFGVCALLLVGLILSIVHNATFDYSVYTDNDSLLDKDSTASFLSAFSAVGLILIAILVYLPVMVLYIISGVFGLKTKPGYFPLGITCVILSTIGIINSASSFTAVTHAGTIICLVGSILGLLASAAYLVPSIILRNQNLKEGQNNKVEENKSQEPKSE